VLGGLEVDDELAALRFSLAGYARCRICLGRQRPSLGNVTTERGVKVLTSALHWHPVWLGPSTDISVRQSKVRYHAKKRTLPEDFSLAREWPFAESEKAADSF
jgi:hypothetical protein